MIPVRKFSDLQCNCSWKLTLDKWITFLIETHAVIETILFLFNSLIPVQDSVGFCTSYFVFSLTTNYITFSLTQFSMFSTFTTVDVPSMREVGHAKWNTTGALKLRLLTDWYRWKKVLIHGFISVRIRRWPLRWARTRLARERERT